MSANATYCQLIGNCEFYPIPVHWVRHRDIRGEIATGDLVEVDLCLAGAMLRSVLAVRSGDS